MAVSDSGQARPAAKCCGITPLDVAIALSAGGIFVADQVAKLAVADWLPYRGSHAVVEGFFNIVHVRNTGMAFSLFADSAPWVRTWVIPAVSVAALVLVVALIRRSGQFSVGTRAALALILGGAAGNLWDRWSHGYVTDFLDFYVGGFHWPAFNVADSAITVGVALMLLESFRGDGQAERKLGSRAG